MLPRIQAQEALRWANISAFPHMDAKGRKELTGAWQATARGAIAEIGPRQLHNAADVRAWFASAGFAA